MQFLTTARRPGEPMLEDWKQSGSYQKGLEGWRQPTNPISAPHLAKLPSLQPGSTNTEASTELFTLCCWGVNLFQLCWFWPHSFQSEGIGYSAGTVPALAQLRRTDKYAPSCTATVVTAPADWKSMKASQQDCPQRLQTRLISTSLFSTAWISGLVFFHAPFSKYLRITSLQGNYEVWDHHTS